MVFTLSFNAGLMAQVVDSEEINPEELFPNYRHITPEKPDYYPPATALRADEMHVLDTLSNAERQIIEEAVDPPAVGVIRELRVPVVFNLAEIDIPAEGEITTSGGRLSRISEDYLAWTTRFKSGKADEIRIFFAEGNFPHGVEVNLFSDDDYAFNQYDLRGELDEYGFYTTTTFSNHVTVQILIPVDAISGNLHFVISKLIHADHRYFPEENYRSCFLDANCSTANSFAHISSIRGGTARLFFPTGSRYGLCTGGQLNDIRSKDWQPFLLTANHCFDTQASAAGLEARFSYWSTYCNSGVVNPDNIIINGANLLATNSNSDVTLVLLKQNGGTTYMGWDAGSVANNTTMHSVHHPGGTLMKYQRMTNKSSPSFSCGGFSTSDFYYTKTTDGQEEPGSSGGSVVDPDGRVRGQLYGWCYLAGADRCDYDTYYNMWGRFDVSYTQNNFGYWLYNGGASVAMATSPGSSLFYGTLSVGSTYSYDITVYNTGTRPNYMNLQAGTASITGPNAGDFTIIGGTYLYLPPGESGTFTVQFSPGSPGMKTATLNIPHNADNIASPKTISLSGYGNPCSDIISLNGGGTANTKTFSKSGEGAWLTTACGFNCNGNEQIYSYVAPVTGTYRIGISSTNSMWVDYFWKSGSCASTGWNCINDVYSPGVQGNMSWTAGTTYLIMLDAESTSLSTHSFYVYPDPCANAISIDGTGPANSKTYTGGGNGIWYTSSASACGYYCPGLEQVYTFIPSQTGNYSIQVTSGGSWVDYMWKSGSCSGEDWNCIDDVYNPGQYGSMFWEAGNTYLLLLDDENSTAGNHTFYIELTEATGTWTGLVNTNWHNSGNWTFNYIPDGTTDVTIPDGTPYSPYIQSNNAVCKSLTIEPGATLTLGAYNLEVNGPVNVHGTFTENNTASKLYVYGSIFWHDGSAANATGSATIFVEDIWEFKEGAEVFLNSGYVEFFGSSPGYIRSKDDDSYFYHVRNNKGGSELGMSSQCSNHCRLHGNLYIYSNCELTSYTSQSLIIGNYVNNMSGAIHMDNGGFVFDGSGGTSNFMPGDYFNNLTISSTGVTIFDDDIEVRGDVHIESGALNPGGTTMTVLGDWTTDVGVDGFVEGASRVIFNGPGHQYVNGDEHFNILEVNNGAALRLNDVSYDVSCNTYDWTAGGIDIVAGNFTAYDLADNGLYGTFWCNPDGTLTLTQDPLQYTDLNGEIHLFGGNMTVHGGNGASYWPYTNDALIVITGGVLSFPDVSIRLSTGYNLDQTITGGVLQTGVSFYDYRGDFVPSGGALEFIGDADGVLSLTTGSTLKNLKINKSAKTSAPASVYPGVISYRDGTEEILSRANNISLSTDATVAGNMEITAGSFDLNGHQLTVNGSCDFFGQLVMEDAADIFNCNYTINWNSGSSCSITAGEFNLGQYMKFFAGSDVQIGTGNTLNLIGNIETSIFNESPTTELGNVIVNMPSGASYCHTMSTEPIHVTGDMTVMPGNHFKIQMYDLIVDGQLDIRATALMDLGSTYGSGYLESNGSLLLSGVLLLDYEGIKDSGTSSASTVSGSQAADADGTRVPSDDAPGVALVHGNFTFDPSATIIIPAGGSFTWDAPALSGVYVMGGVLMLADGTFEVTNRSIRFSGMNDISGGTIRAGRSLISTLDGAFKPTGGTVEMIGSSTGNYIQFHPNNYFYNLTIDRGNPVSIYSGTSITLKNDMHIVSGALNTNSLPVYVGGNWTNDVGDAGFGQATGTVYFNRTGALNTQFIFGETFYNLTNQNTDGKLYIDAPVVVENNYLADNTNLITGPMLEVQGNLDLTMGELALSASAPTVEVANLETGGTLTVTDGLLNVYDFNDDGFKGEMHFYDGEINFTQVDGFTDMQVLNLTVENAVLNINGSVSDSWWGIMTINQSGGEINFMNQGIYIKNIITENITGGVLRCNGAFQSDFGGFTPSGGTVEFTGPDDAFINIVSGTDFYNLTVNKDGTADNSIHVKTDREGNPIEYSRSNMLSANCNFTVKGDLNIINSTFDQGSFAVKVNDDVNVQNGGLLQLGEGAKLILSGSTAMQVQNGGSMSAIGSQPSNAMITHSSGYYTFDVMSGGNISAQHVIFEYMGSQYGINIHDGAVVDVTNNFSNCTFRNGNGALTDGALLTLNNHQDLNIFNVAFPTTGTDYNVAKYQNYGSAEFFDYTGIFSGENYDYEPYNRLYWYVPELSVTPAARYVASPAGTTTFSITSNTTWSVSESVPWLSVNPMSGSNNKVLTVTYSENTALTSRTGYITISGDGTPDVTVSVVQSGISASLSVLPSIRNVTADAGSTTFSVSSNTTWTVSETSPWLSAVPASGSNNGTITVYFNQNLSGSLRAASIDVTAGGGTPEVTVTVSQAPYETHTISLNAGWQGLSSYVMPVEDDIELIFDPVVSNLVLAATFDGNIYYPGSPPVNTIVLWASQSAYQVKMSGTTSLAVMGNSETNRIFSLSSGWNLVPVICNTPVDAGLLFGSADVEVVKDVAGLGVYWPDMAINTLGDLLPGRAYFARMNTSGSVSFPPDADEAWNGIPPKMRFPVQPWNEVRVAPVSHLIALRATATADLQPGDVVVVFTPGEICCGATAIDEPGQQAVINAFADDPYTTATTGFAAGEPMHFGLFRPQTGERMPLAVTFESGRFGSDVFENHGLSVIDGMLLQTTGTAVPAAAAVSIFPNPTDGSIRIAGIKGFATLELYSAQGDLVMQKLNNAASELNWNLSALPPGIYHLRLSGTAGLVIKKLVRK